MVTCGSIDDGPSTRWVLSEGIDTDDLREEGKSRLCMSMELRSNGINTG
jgi:hypothetical protein